MPSPFTEIDSSGDLVLNITDEAYPSSAASYRVNADLLRVSSSYFKTLLDPTKFAEGIGVQKTLESLGKRYRNPADAPASELPTVRLDNVGRIGKVKDIRPLVTDFLRILHGMGLSSGHLTVPLSNLANLAIVADRFDALEPVRAYARKFNLFVGTQRRKSEAVAAIESYSEEKSRMRLLVAILLQHQPWFQDSATIIIKGSKRWAVLEDDVSELPLWWDLPNRIEGK